MCMNPIQLPTGGEGICRVCRVCVENRIKDWTGRAIAESQHARACHFVTLTYRGDGSETRMLTYPDVSSYLKRVRAAGFPLRFFCVGEYGSQRDRAHWHLLIWWQDADPSKVINPTTGKPWLKMNWNCDQSWWDAGYSKYEVAGLGAHKYIMKYITKDLHDDKDRVSEQGYSKKPLLGYRYFSERAKRIVQADLAPQTRMYSFRDFKGRDGLPMQFWMSDATLDFFCAEYLRWWSILKDGHHPASPLLEEYGDRLALASQTLELHRRRVIDRPWLDPRNGERAKFNSFRTLLDFDHITNSWCYGIGDERVYWSFNAQGDRAWRDVIVSPAQAAKLKAAYETRQMFRVSYREASRGG